MPGVTRLSDTKEPAGDAGRRTGRKLAKEEIEVILRRGFWGVLALSVDDEPYGVPIIYAYDDDGTFYIANGPGKKIEMMQQNPNVTLTVVELEDYGRKWRSVIAYGRVELVETIPEKLHAFNALRKQIPRPATRLSDAAKLAAAKVIRLIPTDITGKAID
jgi:nitroimidazol reductase NimA-like FMN-containing flavoprotein (pyridoxamine 5'-phosphate oxidase superfamily)